MPTTDPNQANLRHLPKVHALLETEPARALLAALPRPVVLDEVRAELDALRRKVLAGEAAPPFDEAHIFEAIKRRLAANDLRRLQRVINATGIVIHTNMGRAPMAEAAVVAVASAGAQLLQSRTGTWKAANAAGGAGRSGTCSSV